MRTRPIQRLCLLTLLVPALSAAPIPKLYNTGVDDEGNPLPIETVDPHYTIVYSEDPLLQGPDALTLAPGFPVPPWIAEGPNSKWISISSEQGNAAGGTYFFETTFDLTGFDPSTARILGKWAVDNEGFDIILNDQSLAIGNSSGFGGFSDFEIDFGFVEGINRLQFVVVNAGTAASPMGLRVEMIGIVDQPGEAPSIVTQPAGTAVLEGENVVFSILAQGEGPLAYQWKLDGVDIEGAIEPTLSLSGVSFDNAGEYTVEVTNAHGNAESVAVRLDVLAPVTTLYNTGVDNDHFLLADGEIDPHYSLVESADGESEDAFVLNSEVFPIVAGPWVPNNETSKWIGPRFSTVGAGGDYTYQTTFDLTGLNPTRAFIAGRWTSDNAGLGIVLNGVPTGITQPGSFGTFHDFRIESGFVSGVNTLEFRVNNADAVEGHTGLRVDELRGGAAPVPPDSEPVIATSPESREIRAGQGLTLSVVASGAEPLTFQWRLNGEDIEGATSPSYAVGVATEENAGTYTVVVRNPYGVVESTAATVVVEPSSELDIAMFTGLSVGGLPGQRVLIEFVDAPGLNNWQTLEEITITTDPTFYLDPTSHINTTRQYRVTPIQP